MFGIGRRSSVQIRRSQRHEMWIIEDKRQKALALALRNVLQNAGYTYYNFDEVSADGVSVSVSNRFNSTKSVSVSQQPDFTGQEAQKCASVIVRTLQAIIGEKQAKQLVRVTQRRLPLQRLGVKDAQGNPLSYMDYIDVTVTVPENAVLRRIYTKLG